MDEASFLPIGRTRSTHWPIRRRTFLGSSLVPGAAVLGTPVGWATPTTKEAPPVGLHFVEDRDGLTIVEDSASTATHGWRLLRQSFGPKTSFLLRTLPGGPEVGYELHLSGARFGRLSDATHSFYFERASTNWCVRLRTELFSAGVQLTSQWVRFAYLTEGRPDGILGFDAHDTGLAIPGLVRAFEGHVQIRAPARLAMHHDGVWRLQTSDNTQLALLNGAFQLDAIEFAWCEPDPGSRDVPGSRDPVFRATSVATPGPRPMAMAAGHFPNLTLRGRDVASRPTVSGGAAAAVPMRWTLSREDWQPKPRGPAIAGTSRLTAAWTLEVRSRRGLLFGPVELQHGTLQWANAAPLGMVFAGELTEAKIAVQSALGGLCISGYTPDRAPPGITPQGARRGVPEHHPQVTAAAAGPDAPLQLLDLPMLLHGADLKLPGCDFSEFEFGGSALHALFAADPRIRSQRLARAQSYLWLGEPRDLGEFPAVHLDLTRTRLSVARATDMVRLAFLFDGLHLDVTAGKVWLVDSKQSCRVVQRALPVEEAMPPRDTRPILVVEFGPQHVFEESLFRPNPPPLPEVALVGEKFDVDWPAGSVPSRSTFPAGTAELVAALQPLSLEQRLIVRRRYADLKLQQEQTAGKPFAKFSTALALRLRGRADWREPAIYIGPEPVDPEIAAIARAVQRDPRTDIVTDELTVADELIKKLIVSETTPPVDLVDRWLAAALKLFKSLRASELSGQLPFTLQARLRELTVAGVSPAYGQFRDYYMEAMTNALFKPNKETADPPPDPGRPVDLEFFSPANRKWLNSQDSGQFPSRELDHMEKREAWASAVYANLLSKPTAPPALMRGRLSGPSRLAFRVDCRRGAASTKPSPLDSPEETRLAFDFATLTDWTGLEMAVMPRAQKPSVFDQAGILVSEAADAKEPTNETDDVVMLRMLNFRSGRFVTAGERLADVEASLHTPPNALETSIEMPARLMLSPSQHARWRTPRMLADASEHRPVSLWSATLELDGPDPLVRAVHSPDLRPGALRSGRERLVARGRPTAQARTPILYAPQRGPRAPWTLGIEEGDGQASGPETFASSPQAAASAADPACPPTTALSAASSRAKLERSLLSYLCARRQDRMGYGRDAVLRSSLDAYERHELVLLTSAWGLPVRGQRELSGQLQALQAASQVELPAGWLPIDLELGSALYRPRPLQVREMRLTALGGTLRHDSDFVPPTAARHVIDGPLFDTLSIERWQHWIVLGRDVFAEVVYKGYLFPIGHRASLVKQTERMFLRPLEGGPMRAYLRQRMFIRIGRPDKAFPAVGQPNGGRQFPARQVWVLTQTTPDIVDPLEDIEAPPTPATIAPGGRYFPNEPGLVFWPRTARLNGAEVRFDLQFEAAVTQSPLVFVDNTAANDPGMLERLVDIYNGIESPDVAGQVSNPIVPKRHLRTLAFGGQSMRYCDELKPGDSSHKTQAWTWGATGGVGGRVDDGMEGPVRLFDDPTLAGADQPPFYPSVRSMRIRVDQVERITGSPPRDVLVQFDGFYVKQGFLIDSTGVVDPLQIYLDVVSDVSVSTGPNGDRAGALYRTEGLLIGLCRSRGPLLGAQRQEYGKLGTLTDENGSYPARPATAPAPVANALAPAPVPATSSMASKQIAFKSYFSAPPNGLDANLLGIITIKQLLTVMRVASAEAGLPAMKEVLEYGTNLANNTASFIHENIVLPILKAVEALDERWERVGSELRQQFPGVIGGMSDVFPDVDQALTDLLAALHASSAPGSPERDDSDALFGSLAAIYESGRRLVDACTRVTANPLEPLQELVKNQLGKLSHDINQYRRALQDAVTSDLQVLLASVIGDAQDILRLFDYPPAWMHLLADRVADLAPWLNRQKAAAIRKAVDVLRAPPDIKPLIDAALADASDAAATNFTSQVRQAVHDWIGRARQPIVDAKPSQDSSDPLVQVLRELKKVDDDINDRSASADIQRLDRVVRQLLDVARVLRPLSQAKLDPAALCRGLAALIELDLGGPLPRLPAPQDLESQLNESLRMVDEAIKAVADKAATLPTLPATPAPDTEFAIPKDWSVPGASGSLADRVHQVAKAIAAALEPSKKLAPPALRKRLSAFGWRLLTAELQLQSIASDMGADVHDLTIDSLSPASDIRRIEAALQHFGSNIDRVLVVLVTLANEAAAAPQDLASAALADAGAALRRTVVQAIDWLQAISDRIGKVLGTFEMLDPEAAKPLKELAARLDTSVKSAHAYDDPAGAGAPDLPTWLASPERWWPSGPGVETSAKQAAAAVIDRIESEFSLKIRGWASLVTARADHVIAAIASALVPIRKAYETLEAQRLELYNLATDTIFQPMRGIMLVDVTPDQAVNPPQKPEPIGPTNDQLHRDVESLRLLEGYATLQTAPAPEQRARAIRFLTLFLRGWQDGNSTPQRLVQQVQRLSLGELRGRLLQLIDFNAIREDIEHQIKQLLPTAATLSHGFKATFDMAQDKELAKGIFLPRKDCALDVLATTRVDLLNGTPPQFSAKGDLGAFDIQLVGKDFDALTLQFNGVHFESTGGPIKCDLQYAGFKIGEKLQFLSTLGSFFSSGPRSGFYLKALDAGLGIEAGYGLPVSAITIGNLAFFNISLNAAARLRFDGKPATFVASLSRRDAPFTIAVAPYGGSGFFAIEATAAGIVGFEASFEYGGAGAFAYGPLSGQGRLMTGVYIRQAHDKCDISATFYAGGSASIWIFSCGASLSVSARPSGNRIVGDAVYSFSFSMGPG